MSIRPLLLACFASLILAAPASAVVGGEKIALTDVPWFAMAPLSSGCHGDSGGPLVAGPNDAPVLLGVVSWGGDHCGADHLPSVFADVERYRSFITDPSPTWAPTRKLAVQAKGSKQKLTCTVTGEREPGTELAYVWKRLPRWGKPVEVGHGRTYKPASKNSRVACFVYSSNAGGEILAGTDDITVKRG